MDTPAEAPKPKTSSKKDNKKMYMIIGGVVAVLLVLGVLSRVMNRTATNGVGLTTNGNGSATLKTANGDEISTGTQSLPKDFPGNVPTYPGTIVQGTRLTTDGKVGWSVVIETKDDAAKVTDSLTKSFSSNGWTTSVDNKTADGGLLAAENGNLHVQATTVTQNGKTTISYVVVTIPQQ
jgi:hypothetical protein